MPRAYCPECGAEVPVDEDGRCHVGHQVDLAAATGNQDLAEAARGLEAEFEEQHPDEPEPWVAEVEETAAGGSTPPPVGDEGPGAVGRDADDELEPAERPAATSPGESEGWAPPTADPVGPGPQPPPEPAAPPDVDDDFDLDDLEAAVAELEVQERGDARGPEGAVTQPPPPVGDTTAAAPEEDRERQATVEEEPGPPPPSADAPREASGAEPDVSEHPSAEPEVNREEDSAAPSPPVDDADEGDEPQEPENSEQHESPAEVDLSNFTASGERVGNGKKKRGLFGFGR
ncbi:MAG: hypothetical protein R3320_00790 [Nitriliruptorales bacterium]|nr:hypothetical protein [Nitriliruptorales bacterium]